MTQLILTAERETLDGGADDTAPAARPRFARWPVIAMGAGLIIVAVAAAALIDLAGRPIAEVPAPAAITLTAGDVSVVTQVYEPGEESGWHSHSGIHAVAILSGVLTVYDAACGPQTFEAGRPYVGGQDAHLVRNEGDVPVVMAVTYLSPTSGAESTRRLPPPAGCRG